MIFNRSEWPAGLFLPVVPGMMKIKCGTMIDQPHFPVPGQHVCIAWSTIHICNQAIEPNHVRSQYRINFCNSGIKTDSTRKIMKCQVHSHAELQQVLYLLICFSTAKSFIHVGKNDLRHLKTKSPGNFTTDQFGNKSFDALSRSAKFHYI